MSICSFCLRDYGSPWVTKRGDTFSKCTKCAQVSKKCRKGDGIYYSIDDACYLTGTELAAHFADKTKPAVDASGTEVEAKAPARQVLLDCHGVLDLFEPDEFKEILSSLPAGTKVAVLSFVGSTTGTRVSAHQQILKYGVPGYLCFARSDTPSPGSKGGFVQSTGVKLSFADDSTDHVASVKATGSVALHVSSGMALHQRKKAIRDFLMRPAR